MKRTHQISIPAPIARLQEELNEFRANHPARTKLPASIWQTAAELAREHGVYAVAHPLRLDYMGLKRRMGQVVPAVRVRKTPPKTAGFIELLVPEAYRETCVVELESARGGKMRVHLQAGTTLDWTGLLRAWRDAEV